MYRLDKEDSDVIIVSVDSKHIHKSKESAIEAEVNFLETSYVSFFIFKQRLVFNQYNTYLKINEYIGLIILVILVNDVHVRMLLQVKAAKERAVIPPEVRVSQFRELLAEKQVSLT